MAKNILKTLRLLCQFASSQKNCAAGRRLPENNLKSIYLSMEGWQRQIGCPRGHRILRFGGPGRDRTDDLFHAMEARSQLRHRPTIGMLHDLDRRKAMFIFADARSIVNVRDYVACRCETAFPPRSRQPSMMRYSTGIKKRLSTVDMIIPPKTVVPTE